jgi:RNA polymerase sigma-70 factor (ECF subfamily)
MKTGSATSTSPTLLGQLQRDPNDEEAWREFVRRYGPKVYRWCRCWKLQPADANDVTQNVLLKLVRRMRTFHYDPARSFRAWLKTLTHHALSDFLKDCRAKGSGVTEPLQETAARDSLVQSLQEEFDQELLEEALARVRLRIAPKKWAAFRLTALDGLPGKEVAAQLGMKVATVFTAKSKVLRMVQEERRRLEEPGRE